MASITCRVRVRADGSVAIPVAARRRLGIKDGDELDVCLTKAPADSQVPVSENPLARIVGIGEGGPPDGGSAHDKYLYGSDQTQDLR